MALASGPIRTLLLGVQQLHRQQHAAVMTLIPTIVVNFGIVLFADTKTDKELPAVFPDRLSVIGAVRMVLRFFVSHFRDEPAPSGIIDKSRGTTYCLLLIGLPVAGAAFADMVQIKH